MAVTTKATEYQRWTPVGCVPIDPDQVGEEDTTGIHRLSQEETLLAIWVMADVPPDGCSQ